MYKSIFIGYPFNHKGYKILDIKTKKIYSSRDVIFHEDHFPFHDALPIQSDFLQSNDSSKFVYDPLSDSPIQSSIDLHSSSPPVNPQVTNFDPPASPTRDVSFAENDPKIQNYVQLLLD